MSFFDPLTPLQGGTQNIAEKQADESLLQRRYGHLSHKEVQN